MRRENTMKSVEFQDKTSQLGLPRRRLYVYIYIYIYIKLNLWLPAPKGATPVN